MTSNQIGYQSNLIKEREAEASLRNAATNERNAITNEGKLAEEKRANLRKEELQAQKQKHEIIAGYLNAGGNLLKGAGSVGSAFLA